MQGPEGQGFTLIEVVVALAILLIGMGALVQSSSHAARNVRHMEEGLLSHWLVMNRLAEYRLGILPGDPGTDEGRVDYAKREWRWRDTIEPSADLSTLRVSATAAPVESGDDVTARVTGFIRKPGP